MVNNSVIKLEDGNDYVVIDKIKVEDKAYVYLTNVKDLEDFCIRKETTKVLIDETEEKYLEGLTEEEFAEAIKLFTEKNNKEA